MSNRGPAIWRIGAAKSVVLDRARLMAIVNVTPDSFFDGGTLADAAAAAAFARLAVGGGADVLDVGGESTRPGAGRVSAAEQISRVVPAIRAIRSSGGALGEAPISVDTTLVSVAAAALDAGADAINDVSAGTEDAGMLALAAERRAGIVLMHRLRPPGEDSYSDKYERPPVYADVVAEVEEFLSARAEAALAAGVDRAAIVLDPGLGFGKSVEQNLELIRRTGELCGLGYPILSGISRKSFTGRYAGLAESTPAERLAPSLELSLEHRRAGASIFRVHDVAETARLLRIDS